DLMTSYLTRHSRNSLWARIPALVPVGTALPGDVFVPAAELTATDFYDEILRPQHILHVGVANLARDAKRSVGLSIFHTADAGPTDNQDLRLLAALVPHVRRASQIAWRLGALAAVDGAKDAALDRIDHGIVLVDGQGRVLFANRAAESIIALDDGLRLVAE